jgi:hypothetical protein
MDNLPVFKDKPEKLPSGEWRMIGTWKGHKGSGVGIDPGMNYGMTMIVDYEVFVWWGKLPKESRTGYRGIHAIEYIEHNVPRGVSPAIVEGAAYNMRKGQVGLEEIRFGFFFGLYHKGYNVSIMPPASIRKAAFGGGRAMATDIWPALNQNGLDSIGCAIAAMTRDE